MTPSRSTWACELKFEQIYAEAITTLVTLHVSVWVEIVLVQIVYKVLEVTLHVSVWVEMAENPAWDHSWPCHAPRERVSWNTSMALSGCLKGVTLHVSVWVEIWLLSYLLSLGLLVTLHVSVWVEIVYPVNKEVNYASRSTWACELKLNYGLKTFMILWSRSTWACELKWLHLLLHDSSKSSRSTWACELKCL